MTDDWVEYWRREAARHDLCRAVEEQILEDPAMYEFVEDVAGETLAKLTLIFALTEDLDPLLSRLQELEEDVANLKAQQDQLDPFGTARSIATDPWDRLVREEPLHPSSSDRDRSAPVKTDLVRLSVAAKALGVSRDTLKNWHAQDRPGAPRLIQSEGGRWYVDTDSLNEALDRRRA